VTGVPRTLMRASPYFRQPSRRQHRDTVILGAYNMSVAAMSVAGFLWGGRNWQVSDPQDSGDKAQFGRGTRLASDPTSWRTHPLRAHPLPYI